MTEDLLAGAVPGMPSHPRGFAPSHRWDRNFYLLMGGLAWLGIFVGFGGSIAQHIEKHRPAYAPIVHVHAVVFVLWLVLFTVQVLLIRSRRLRLHQRLGFALAGLAVVMAVLGPATALTVQHRSIGDPQADPAFLSVQFTDLLAFTGLTFAAIWLRRNPSAHRRLILLGTLYITDAGYARWLADAILLRLGEGYWGMWVALYGAINTLLLVVGLYDLATRRRLHPATAAGMVYAFGVQMIALSLYFSPAWSLTAKRIIAAWPW